jgi:hypothetical protein
LRERFVPPAPLAGLIPRFLSMPSATILPASGSNDGAVSGVRVFLSYAHEDSQLIGKFIDHFGVALQTMRLQREEVLFVDREHLRAGDDWEPALLREIDEAHIFVFLMSASSLHEDGYCMRGELLRAAAKEKRIVPVLLRTCDWEDQKIPGDRRERTLSALTAIPCDPERKVKAVENWEHPDEAWHEVVKALKPLVKEASAAGGGGVPRPRTSDRRSSAQPGAGVVDLDLIPYLCDQQPAVHRFEKGMKAWDTRALVVLVKGVWADNPVQFWTRLRVQYLAKFLDGSLHAPETPLELPVKDQAQSGADRRETLLHELSEMLTGDRYEIENVAGLTVKLREIDGTIAMLALPDAKGAPGGWRAWLRLPRRPRGPTALREALEALLALIDEIEDATVRRRMVVAVNLEDEEVAEARLATEWDLHRFRGSLVVELDRLSAVTSDDAGHWHRAERIRDHFQVEEERVLGLFPPGTRLRLRDFHSAFHRLLDHGGR